MEKEHFVIICKDKIALIEAEELQEALDVFEMEFPEISLNEEKFTVLPVTHYFYEEKKDDNEKAD